MSVSVVRHELDIPFEQYTALAENVKKALCDLFIASHNNAELSMQHEQEVKSLRAQLAAKDAELQTLRRETNNLNRTLNTQSQRVDRLQRIVDAHQTKAAAKRHNKK